jgi:hypothetical protein
MPRYLDCAIPQDLEALAEVCFYSPKRTADFIYFRNKNVSVAKLVRMGFLEVDKKVSMAIGRTFYRVTDRGVANCGPQLYERQQRGY